MDRIKTNIQIIEEEKHENRKQLKKGK